MRASIASFVLTLPVSVMASSPSLLLAAPAAPVVATEFNALGLVWSLVKQFFTGLFGKKS